MIDNPGDDLVDILFNSPQHKDVEVYKEVTEGELAELQQPTDGPEEDPEDKIIDGKIDAVYEAAIDAFNQQTSYTEVIEPRYAARNAEVAANYLSIALNAAATRARVKGDRKRSAAFVPYGSQKQGGVVVASREEIMAMLSVDADVKKID